MDPVDPLACRVAGADLAHEGEVVAAASAQPDPEPTMEITVAPMLSTMPLVVSVLLAHRRLAVVDTDTRTTAWSAVDACSARSTRSCGVGRVLIGRTPLPCSAPGCHETARTDSRG